MSAYDYILSCNYSPWSRYSGGGQKSTHMVACELARKSTVVVLYSRGAFEKVSEPLDLPYDVRWVSFVALRPGISSPLRFLNAWFFYRVAKKIASKKTILIGNGEEAALYPKLKKPFLFASRYPDYDDYLLGRDWSRLSHWLRIFFREPRHVGMALSIRGADRVLVTSSHSKRQVLERFHISENKVEIVPNGIDPAFLETPLCTEEGKGILFFGRLTVSKGVDTLLEAWLSLPEPLQKEHPLEFVGQGPLENSLKEKVQKKDLSAPVVFSGWKAGVDLADRIRANRLVVLPSREESFGNTMLETLACGGELLTTRAGSIPEVVGKHACLVGVDNRDELAAQMEKLLRQAFSKKDAETRRKHVLENFSWAKTVDKIQSASI